MSLLGKKWIIKNLNPNLNTLEKVMQNRGLKDLLDHGEFHDPFLFTGMKKAVDRVMEAIIKQDRIIVFGDYDVDGITGTAILVHALKKMNATVSYRLPHRVNDGYGLTEKFIDEFIEKKIGLIITVDCGISCASVIAKAKENGIDTIITDHHTIPPAIPDDAVAIIHPKLDNNYPFPELTGAGVALKFAQALLKDDRLAEALIDLASLGTVADLGPLKGENRYIVKKGLQLLSKTRWIGLKKIMNMAFIKEDEEINSNTIGFKIAPRINAAGRIGDPYIALSLLLQEEENEKTNLLGHKLEQLNSKRQQMTEIALNEVQDILNLNENIPPLIIAENSEWHAGILGLIASKLIDKYRRPAVIMQDFGDFLVASARSPEYFNIIEALSACKKHLTTFGGHAQAAGFNLRKENLAKFKLDLIEYVRESVKDRDFTPVLEIDCEISRDEIHFDFLSELDKLQPFGVENKMPVFLLNEIEPLSIEQVGKEKEHMKLSLKVKENNVNIIAFQMGKFADRIRAGRKLDIVFHLDRNRWNDNEYLQLKALDFRICNE